MISNRAYPCSTMSHKGVVPVCRKEAFE